MILHSYGCSWTEGHGCDLEIENSISSRDELQSFRNKNSWPYYISEKLGCEVINNGWSSRANNVIFNNVIDDLKNNKIKNGDLVIIMWSSSLRDYVPFLPKGEWVSWSVNHLIQMPEKFIKSYNSDNETFDEFLIDYKNFFISNLYNQNYYNIVNQNYIIFLQKILDRYGVNYLMCDGFEQMLIDLNKKDNVTKLINKKNYWGFQKQTFRDFLIKTNRLDIWEYQDVTFKTRATQHPNREGYKLISQELYNYIVKNNII